jgi:NtrY N-terminal region
MPLTRDEGRRRRNLLIISAVLLVVVVATLSQLRHWKPELPVASNLLVFALFNLNLIVFLLLLVLLFRNLVKLSFERRQRVLGSRFKTKLVLAFLSLALTPGILIFIIASNFINTSIEGWFKPQVERPLDQALEVAQTYYQTLAPSSGKGCSPRPTAKRWPATCGTSRSGSGWPRSPCIRARGRRSCTSPTPPWPGRPRASARRSNSGPGSPGRR